MREEGDAWGWTTRHWRCGPLTARSMCCRTSRTYIRVMSDHARRFKPVVLGLQAILLWSRPESSPSPRTPPRGRPRVPPRSRPHAPPGMQRRRPTCPPMRRPPRPTRGRPLPLPTAPTPHQGGNESGSSGTSPSVSGPSPSQMGPVIEQEIGPETEQDDSPAAAGAPPGCPAGAAASPAPRSTPGPRPPPPARRACAVAANGLGRETRAALWPGAGPPPARSVGTATRPPTHLAHPAWPAYRRS